MAKFEWILDESKYLKGGEVKKLLNIARKRKEDAEKKGNKVAVRDYFIINLALLTGLRVDEMANLKCGDVCIEDGMSSLIVRNGKCGKTRVVKFNGDLRGHFVEYFRWKEMVGEGIEPENPVLTSDIINAHFTTRALQKAFKRCAKKAGLNGDYSIHSLRHTYACELYKASGYNLRLVQKQLGHSSIQTTQVYADVIGPDMNNALRKLYK